MDQPEPRWKVWRRERLARRSKPVDLQWFVGEGQRWVSLNGKPREFVVLKVWCNHQMGWKSAMVRFDASGVEWVRDWTNFADRTYAYLGIAPVTAAGRKEGT